MIHPIDFIANVTEFMSRVSNPNPSPPLTSDEYTATLERIKNYLDKYDGELSAVNSLGVLNAETGENESIEIEVNIRIK
ncbi:MAG: hypothetical protein AAFR81_21110 [Chloroflexota bacterium]